MWIVASLEGRPSPRRCRVVGLDDARGVVPERRLELLPDVGDVAPQAVQGPGLGRGRRSPLVGRSSPSSSGSKDPQPGLIDEFRIWADTARSQDASGASTTTRMTSNLDSNDGGSDVFTDRSALLKHAALRVRAGHDGAPRRERADQARLGHTCFAAPWPGRRPISGLDGPELVDAAHTSIRQHQRAGLDSSTLVDALTARAVRPATGVPQPARRRPGLGAVWPSKSSSKTATCPCGSPH